MAGGYWGSRYNPGRYWTANYFGLTGVASGAFRLEAGTGVITLTGSDITFKAPNKIRGKVRKRRRGRAWDYDRAFAKREAERFESEPFPIPQRPAPKPQPFVSLLETYRPTVRVSEKATRPHWRIEDYQAALAEKRRQQEFERRQQELEDEELLLLLESA